MIDSKLPAYLWPCAIDTAVYTIDRLVKPGQTKPPIQQWREHLGLPHKVFDLKNAKRFGQKCYQLIMAEDRQNRTAYKTDPLVTLSAMMGIIFTRSGIKKRAK